MSLQKTQHQQSCGHLLRYLHCCHESKYCYLEIYCIGGMGSDHPSLVRRGVPSKFKIPPVINTGAKSTIYWIPLIDLPSIFVIFK